MKHDKFYCQRDKFNWKTNKFTCKFNCKRDKFYYKSEKLLITSVVKAIMMEVTGKGRAGIPQGLSLTDYV